MTNLTASIQEALADPVVSYEVFAAFCIVPLRVIFRRAGLKPWPIAFLWIPMVGFCLTGTALAFQRWPVLPERVKKGRKS